MSDPTTVFTQRGLPPHPLLELVERTKADFRFKYVGGGYFRDKGMPKGEKAEVRHGDEIIDEFCQELIKRVTS